MTMNRNKIIALIFSVGALVGCGEAEDSFIFSTPGASESKPVAVHAPLLARSNLTASGQPVTKAAAVNYLISVTSNSGNEVCSGKASIEIMSDFTMKFPTAKIKCLTLAIDMAGIIGASANSSAVNLSNLASDGSVLSIDEIANATFDPPRPMLLGPVVQDPSIYKGFKRTVDTQVTVKDANSKLNKKSAKGQFDLAVIEGPNDVLTTYKNKLSPKNDFDKVLNWTIAAKGFDGIPAKNGLLLKKMEWFWNIEPIMIPKLVIVGELAGFIETDGSQASINQLIGDITIKLAVESWE